MGIGRDCLKFIDAGPIAMNMGWEGMKICELGAQEIRRGHMPVDHLAKNCQYAKQYFEALGAEHVSMDINEKYGSINVDLSKPVPEWNKYFDMLTNFGTTEHIKNDQYQVFKNVHDMIRLNGVMVHSVPMVGRIQRYHNPKACVYYEHDFFKDLAENNDYKIICYEVLTRRKKNGGNLTVTLMKMSDNDFMSEENFKKMGGIKYD